MTDLSLPDLPVHPRLRPGMCWAVSGDAVAVAGVTGRRLFRGLHAATVLPKLLGAMDGRAGWQGLAEAGGCSIGVVEKVLRQLHAAGVVEDLSGVEDLPDTPLSDWYSHATADTERHPSGRAALAALGAVRIVALGGGTLVRRVVELLDAQGLVVAYEAADVDAADLTIVCHDGTPGGEPLEAIDERMASVGGRWILVRAGAEAMSMGPLFDRSLFACLACALDATDAEPRAGRLTGRPMPPMDRDLVEAYWASCVAGEALALVGGAGQPTTVRQMVTVSRPGFPTWTTSVSPASDCATCVIGARRISAEESAGYVYEYALAGLPSSLSGNNSQYGHYTQANQLVQVPKRLSRVEEGLLSTDGGIAWSESATAWARLCRLLAGVYGLRDGSLRRYPPTGGNIGSPRAIVWLCESAWAQRGGWYSYEPQIDALCRFRGSGPAGLLGPTCILQVADIEPLQAKYGSRMQRIAWLDAGVTTMHLELICQTMSADLRLADHERCDAAFAVVAPSLARQVLPAALFELPTLHIECP